MYPEYPRTGDPELPAIVLQSIKKRGRPWKPRLNGEARVPEVRIGVRATEVLPAGYPTT